MENVNKTKEKEELPSNETLEAIAFATWYSGMDRNKVLSAWARWKKEKRSYPYLKEQSSEVKEIKTILPSWEEIGELHQTIAQLESRIRELETGSEDQDKLFKTLLFDISRDIPLNWGVSHISRDQIIEKLKSQFTLIRKTK